VQEGFSQTNVLRRDPALTFSIPQRGPEWLSTNFHFLALASKLYAAHYDAAENAKVVWLFLEKISAPAGSLPTP
jgi:hypothetical protein